MEYMEADIDTLLKHEMQFTEQHLIKIAYHTLCAMSFLHEANVMHRDLKSANILISSDCSAKICDFGLSRSLPSTVTTLEGFNTMAIREHSQGLFDEPACVGKASSQLEQKKRDYIAG